MQAIKYAESMFLYIGLQFEMVNQIKCFTGADKWQHWVISF